MITSLHIKNYGIHREICWSNLGKINLIIGENSCGKSFILKSIYTGMKTVEAAKRGQNNKTEAQILFDKLYWTFQADSIGDLVRKPFNGSLEYTLATTDGTFAYSFGESTAKAINVVENGCGARASNSIYIPEKEVLSIYGIIQKSREQDSVFGFDDTYYDLVKAISIPRQKGRNYEAFAQGRDALRDIIGGSVDYDASRNTWAYMQGKTRFSIGVAAEGIKKIATLDQLLGNRYLDNNSVLIFDEPESGIHPSAITKLMDLLWMLASSGMQIFIATHSYFVLKKLYLLATQNNVSIPLLSLKKQESVVPAYYDLKDGLPDNPIVEESVRLYDEEVSGVL